MTNSDPDSDSGQQNLRRPTDQNSYSPAENGISQEAYGGARPKTRTSGGALRSAGGVRTRQQRCREWEEERNNQISPNGTRRRRRKVHRTNSSDSVFMIPGSKEKYASSKNGNCNTERNSYEEWTENHILVDTPDSDINFFNRVTDRVPPLHDNVLPLEGVKNNANTCASNSTLSLSDYRTEDPSDLENLDMIEDDCYIYTYRGGTAYLSADLPNSFFRLDSGSDGESIPGVSSAGQSNLSTGVAALLQDQLLCSGVQNRPSSPEEPDFLELDFDPGSDRSDLSSEDSGQGRDDEDIVQNSVSERSSPEPPSPVPPPIVLLPERSLIQQPPDSLALAAAISPRRSESRNASNGSSLPDEALSVSPELILQPIIPVEVVPTQPQPLPNYESNPPLIAAVAANQQVLVAVEQRLCTNCDRPTTPDVNPASLPGEDDRVDNQPQAGQTARSVPLVSPVTDSPVLAIPRSKSLNNSISCQMTTENTNSDENVLLCGNRLLLREALLFGRGATGGGSGGTVDIHEAVSRLTLNDVNHTTDAPRAMIWSHKDACRKHVQHGSSHNNNSFAAICNALTALNINISEQELMRSVKVRIKQDKSDLCDYLLSCSEAGFNHVDLNHEIKHICGDRIVARFFPMHNRLVNLNEWLADWISRGCVPLVTLNLQKGDLPANYSPSEAWVNRMVWGVSGRDIFLTNPLEVLPDSCLLPQLDSPSEVLVRRDDIIQRFTPSTNLRRIISNRQGFNQKWREMNVLGQVVNMLRENFAALSEDLTDMEHGSSITSHVRIPALYASGVTIFCDSLDAETASLLLATAELPTRLFVQ